MTINVTICEPTVCLFEFGSGRGVTICMVGNDGSVLPECVLAQTSDCFPVFAKYNILLKNTIFTYFITTFIYRKVN